MIATTVSAICDRIRRDASMSLRSPAYTLAAAVDVDDTTLQFAQQARNQGVGSLLEVGTELMFVISASSSSVEVVRGHFGTTAIAHAAGSVVEVDPRFSRSSLVDWMQLEVDGWGYKLWKAATVDVDVTPSGRTYDLTGVERPLFLLEARLEPASPNWSSWRDWALVDTTLIEDGGAYSVTLAHLQQSTTLRVAYAQRFDLTDIDLDTDLIDDVGMSRAMVDALEKGLRMRVAEQGVLTAIDQRAAGASRAAEEVSPVDYIRAVEMLRSQRDRAIADAGNVLRSTWPIRGA